MKSFALFFIVLFIIACLPVTIHSQGETPTEIVATTSSTETVLLPDQSTVVVPLPTSVTSTSVISTFTAPLKHDMTNVAAAGFVAAVIALF
ncbi:15320_t:CDS:2 [Funneliformis geosporum]|nr:15320_t:CDS:2 [Funneliformis geosporum]